MSHDPWGGGSDEDPKLRLKEIERMRQRERAEFLRWFNPWRRVRYRADFKPLVFSFLVILFAMWVAFGQ